MQKNDDGRSGIAWENHIKIIPLYPYPNGVFRKTEAIRDVSAQK